MPPPTLPSRCGAAASPRRRQECRPPSRPPARPITATARVRESSFPVCLTGTLKPHPLRRTHHTATGTCAAGTLETHRRTLRRERCCFRKLGPLKGSPQSHVPRPLLSSYSPEHLRVLLLWRLRLTARVPLPTPSTRLRIADMNVDVPVSDVPPCARSRRRCWNYRDLCDAGAAPDLHEILAEVLVVSRAVTSQEDVTSEGNGSDVKAVRKKVNAMKSHYRKTRVVVAMDCFFLTAFGIDMAKGEKLIRARRWWGMLSTAVQRAVGGPALGAPWLVSKGAAACEPGLDHVLALAEPAGPSRLPLR
ncbi:hypothetical protein AK812_SmicGene30694 [Symbiodinium microadriaticum]|uniref:Uncharacterized protein n=1 Tax=Symbiodinium microadriaticum TaxID=2951 RepID=A0A1Q9CYJ8_SYMMI|nr:hypothetical protein AK812_SmicGene30694 [Symbiodinium microadriaticum]